MASFEKSASLAIEGELKGLHSTIECLFLLGSRGSTTKQKGKIYPENETTESEMLATTTNPPWTFGGVQRSFSRLLRFDQKKQTSIPLIPEIQKVEKKKKVEFDNIDEYWKREEYGGIKIWVNAGSGDVSVEYPVLNEGSKQRSIKKKLSKESPNLQNDNESTKRIHWQEIHKTIESSRKYNNPEMQELFDLIDCRSSSRRISEIVQEKKRNYHCSQGQKLQGQKKLI